MIVKNLNFGIRSIYGLVLINDLFVIREQNRVLAINMESFQPQWEIEFEKDNMFGVKVLYSHRDLIYTVAGRGDKNQLLYAINEEGEIKWEKEIGWELSNTFGGIYFKDSELFYQESDTDNKTILINVVEAVSGKKILTSKLPYSLPSIQSFNDQTSVFFENLVYEKTKNGNLIGIDFQLNVQESPLGLNHVLLLKVVGDNLLILSENGQRKLYLVQKGLNKIKEFPISMDEGISRFEILNASFEKILFLSKAKNKLTSFDVKTEKVKWEYKTEDDYIIYDFLIDKGNALLTLNSIDGFTFIKMDLTDGEVNEKYSFEDDTLRGYPFLHEKKVLFCSDSGLNELEGIF